MDVNNLIQPVYLVLAQAILEQTSRRPEDFPEVVAILGKASLSKWAEQNRLRHAHKTQE